MARKRSIIPNMNGSRVQLSPATDAWMMGDRYGVIIGSGYTRDGKPFYRVKMDVSKKVRKVPLDLLDINPRKLSPSEKRQLKGEHHTRWIVAVKVSTGSTFYFVNGNALNSNRKYAALFASKQYADWQARQYSGMTFKGGARVISAKAIKA